jgi:acyl phosphate:glycerol-3-phosphate acyltransferase
MNAWIALAGTLLGFFLIGGIPFGFIAGKMRGVDLRQAGSGNIGATNAIRVLGKTWGFPVFALDVLKAFVPLVLLQQVLAGQTELFPLNAQLVLILAAVAAVLGHNYCPYLGFKGGKGMATSAGVLFALLPWSCFTCFALFGLIFSMTRYVSLASIVAAIGLPIATFYFYPGKHWFFLLAMLLGLMAVWRHRGNIQRLREGTELRFGDKKS